VPEQLISIDPVEPDLSPERIDARLAGGWFPWGQRWMTCRAWPMEEGPRDTIWVRVRLAAKRMSDRARRLVREGCTATWLSRPTFDEEHQALYDQFRESKHADWTESIEGLLLHDGETTPLFEHTREIAVRDAAGRLIAFRWFLEGRVAIAGMAAIYDPTRSGLGTVARTIADQWAGQNGRSWSYPGYVWPGAEDTWFYKIKRGRTEWLDPDRGTWRAWDGDEPNPEHLGLAEMRRRLAKLGQVVAYPAWAAPCIDPSCRGLAAPYFVPGHLDGDELTVFVWNVSKKWYEELRVVVQTEEPVSDGVEACA
jgi:arginyl-tRNA--protein-N-Asp/Glu arginylyltransferase